GLIISDESAFLEIIEKKSYYRLSGYWYPLLEDKPNHIFKSDANLRLHYKSIHSTENCVN
ncbi:MAG: hypothetical protein KAS71_09430, partial [Bacteroidales bacterium]|nr:hypothetical protein [Bacteroidales bacterium]